MPAHRRHHPHARRRALPIQHEHDRFWIWTPDADAPIVLDTFGDVAMLAFDLLDMSVEREALILLDDERCLTAMLADPPATLGVLIGRCDIPGLEVPFSSTIDVVLVDRIEEGPASEHDRSGYVSLRRLHALQGLRLLDVVQVDGERVRSLAIACDPDPVWFEQPGPGPAVADGDPPAA